MQRRDGALLTVTPTLDTNAYASGDVLFTPVEMTNVVLDTKGLAVLRTLTLLDKSNNKQAIDLLFFNDNPGDVGAANAAFAMTDTQFNSFIGRVSIATGDYVTATTGANADVTKLIEMLLAAKAASKSIWVVGVVRSGTPTYANGDLILKLLVERY